MKTFFIITNDGKDPDLAITKKIESYLQAKGAECRYATLSALRKAEEKADQLLPAQGGLGIVLGGDGSMLEATHLLKDRAMPLLGINLGNVGYLTETNADGITDTLDKLLADQYTIEKRMMLEGSLEGSASDFSGAVYTSLNDIVIARFGSIRMIRLSVYVNDRFLCDYHADGLIFATPTGSTGYNMSAGGPIVEPVADLILMTPVASHALLSSRSIILSPSDVIRVEVHPRHEDEEVEAEVSFDGAHTVRLCEKDVIRVCRSVRTTDIIRLEEASFLDVLHKKMV